MIEKLLSRKEVAEIFSVTPTTIRLWQINGVIHSYCNVNGRPRYHIDEINKVINLKTTSNDSE
jgi:predicted site-specific integrase-resolvase